MAAKFLELFFLIIGTAGISNVYSLQEFFNTNKRPFSVWPNLEKDSIFGLGVASVPHFFRSKKNYIDLSEIHRPIWGHDDFHSKKSYIDFSKVLSSRWRDNDFFRRSRDYEASEESIRETDDINEERETSNDQKHPDYIKKSSSSSPATPTESYAYSETGISSISSDGVNFASDLPAIHRRLPIFLFSREYSKDSRVTRGISNTEFPLIIPITPTEWRKKSFSDINNEYVGLTDSKNTFTTFENSSERVVTKSLTNNQNRKNASEFLTNISTKNGGIDDSFIGKYEDRIDGDSTTSDPTIPGAKSETSCTLCNFFTFLKTKKKVLRTESSLILDISTTTKKEATDVSDQTNFLNGIEITKREDSTIVSNIESASAVFHPLSLMKATSLNDQVRYSNGIEQTSQKEFKLEPTVTESSPLNSQEIHSISTTKNIQTNSDIYFSSFAVTFDGTTPQSKLSLPFETRLTIENLENKQTAESFLSSVKATVLSFVDKVTKDSGKEIFSTISPSLEIHFEREVIKEDHIIEISSIRTARIVVTTVFLVIALTALTLLVVYLFRLRRREVQYDQLMLIS